MMPLLRIRVGPSSLSHKLILVDSFGDVPLISSPHFTLESDWLVNEQVLLLFLVLAAVLFRFDPHVLRCTLGLLLLCFLLLHRKFQAIQCLIKYH